MQLAESSNDSLAAHYSLQYRNAIPQNNDLIAKGYMIASHYYTSLWHYANLRATVCSNRLHEPIRKLYPLNKAFNYKFAPTVGASSCTYFCVVYRAFNGFSTSRLYRM